ncbi:FAD binding domain-containing protein [Treponema sp.]|uniref:FAD binding domain-containing protein n=1 Tax=Treponema sp. TaxID=166 RepID=UPI00388E3D5E
MASSKTFFYAKNLEDVFYQMKTISDLKIVAGCTSFIEKEFYDKVLSIRDINELKIIDKHERYLDIGAAIKLSEVAELGEANLPATIYEAIATIANPSVRNIATIGGNICSKGFYNTLFASFLALDASLEFRNGEDSSFLSITNFEKIPEGKLLSKIRLPTEEWEVSVFRRLGPTNVLNELSASFVFLVNSQKNQISDIRIAMAGSFKFRDQDLENKIIGAHLPLSQTAISNFLLEAESSFDENVSNSNLNPILKRQFWNLVKYSLEQLT